MLDVYAKLHTHACSEICVCLRMNDWCSEAYSPKDLEACVKDKPALKSDTDMSVEAEQSVASHSPESSAVKYNEWISPHDLTPQLLLRK